MAPLFSPAGDVNFNELTTHRICPTATLKKNANITDLSHRTKIFAQSKSKTMSPRSLSSAVGCAALLAAASAFSPSATHQHQPLLSSSTAASTTSVAASPQHATEESYPSLLQSASICAHSDSCSIDLAEEYLQEIVHVQSGCAAGTLSGGVCDDVLNVSAIVADLRVKIDEGKVGVKREAA